MVWEAWAMSEEQKGTGSGDTALSRRPHSNGFGWWTTKCYKRTESLGGEHYHLSLKLNSRMKGGNEAGWTFLTFLSISNVRDSHCCRWEGELWSLVVAEQETHFFSYLVDRATTRQYLWGKVWDHWWARSMRLSLSSRETLIASHTISIIYQ